MEKATRCIAGLAVAVVLALGTTATVRADEKTDSLPWYEKFSGHENWSYDLTAVLAQAAKENRPVLVDFFGKH